MAANYSRLWKLLIDRNINKTNSLKVFVINFS